VTGRSPRPSPASDHELAVSVARSAGEVLLDLRDAWSGAPADQLRAEGDRRSHRLIVEALARVRPDDAVLSEEGADDPARLERARVWVVDPLDGTREYAEPGRADWAVHVALWSAGDLVAGAVAVPARQLCLATEPPPVPPGPVPRRPRLVVSRSRPPAVVGAVRAALDGELVEMGSAGAKAMAVVLGEADIYVHAGGQYEWDSAAPVAVARAAGLHTSRLDGAPLHYNQPDPWLPDLVVCRPELASPVLEALAAVAAG